jgi:hypothetical protein
VTLAKDMEVPFDYTTKFTNYKAVQLKKNYFTLQMQQLLSDTKTGYHPRPEVTNEVNFLAA